jgi:uncharacterized protein
MADGFARGLQPVLQPIEAAHHEAVLRLNHDDVQYLSPLDGRRLDDLLARSCFSRVLLAGDEAVGFVLVFGPGAGYDSENYRWFEAHHERFWYLDRIVVAPSLRRRGAGSLVYDTVEAEVVAAGMERLCCEVNLLPRNDASLAFHLARGYGEVGQLGSEAAGKLVSLLEKELA